MKIGTKSLEILDTLHPDLQEIIKEIDKDFDLVLTKGFVSKEEQELRLNRGETTNKFGESPHSQKPSEAVHLAQYHKDTPHVHWNNIPSFTLFAGILIGVAWSKGIMLTWGGDKNHDFNISNLPEDWVHFELTAKMVDGKWVSYKELRKQVNK